MLALLLALGASAAERPALDRRIGQTIVVTVSAKDASRYEDWIERGRIGGVLLRTGAMEAGEVKAVIDRLQKKAAASGSPLLVSVDNEGGPQFTLRSMGLTVFPSNMARGATYSDLNAFLASYWSARELRSIGVSMNFAPVLDVNTNSDNPIIGLRSFGNDPDEVASLGAIAIEGSLRGRVVPVAKHFPGHGDTARDSHKALPTLDHKLARLEQVELKPFRAAIAAKVPAIMTAHIAYPALDPSGRPATLSKPIVTGLLRERLGFEGVVVTDSLDMKAITSRWSVAEASVEALKAGCDLLLVGGGGVHEGVFDRIVEALATGELAEARLDDAAARIARLKEELGLDAGATPLADVERERIRKSANEIADQSVTVLRDDAKLLPLAGGKTGALVVFAPPGFSADLAVLRDAFEERLPGSAVIELEPAPEPAAVKAALAKVGDAAFLVVGTFHWSTARYDAQVKAVEKLAKLGKPMAVVSLMNPYDQKYFEAPTRLATYGITPASMRSLARVLFGYARPKGFLPVAVSTP